MKGIIGITSFIFGAGLGVLCTYRYMNDKCEEKIREEIDAYKRDREAKDLAKASMNKPDISEIVDAVRKYDSASNYSKEEVADILEEDEDESDIKFIDPNRYGDDPDYDQYSYTYYSDGVLTDENDDVIEDTSRFGDFEKEFGTFEEDSVYIQNDTYKCYYEILRDYRPFNEED